METWKAISGYETLYEISDHGNVRNRHGRLLKYRKTDEKNPYYKVGLSVNNVQTLFYIHRLVLTRFNPHPNQDDLSVDHIDGQHLNNKVSNLQWLTISDNAKQGQKFRSKRSVVISEKEVTVTDLSTGQVKVFRLVE